MCTKHSKGIKFGESRFHTAARHFKVAVSCWMAAPIAVRISAGRV
jgi:hypothetical protein